jgi:hypothetical protein
VNWTKNVSFSEDANPAKVVKEVNVYEMSIDSFSQTRFFSVSFTSAVEGVECRKGDRILDTGRLVLVV